MNKFILGGILAAISLMAIYGTSASNQVVSRVDNPEPVSSQGNFGQGTPTSTTGGNPNSVVALNTTEAQEVKDDPFVDVSAKTPLEKAGTIPQRQTIGTTPNFGATTLTTDDDTNGQVIEPVQPAPKAPAPATTTTPPTAAPATPAPKPVRALW